MSMTSEAHLLLRPEDFQPLDTRFRVFGVFNPGAVRVNDEIVLLVRVAQGTVEKREGFVGSPRSVVRDGKVVYEVDWLEIAEGGGADYRKPELKQGGQRLSFISHLELVRLTPDGRAVKSIEKHPSLFGADENEEFGVEDPRITRIGDTYYITYVAVSRKMGVNTSLMSTKDFKTFTRHGVIFCWENKDVVLFPETIDGMYWAFHRPVGNIKLSKLAIVCASSPDLAHWGNHHYVLGCESAPFSAARIGAGTPPIRTDAGWLSIYHGVRHRDAEDPFGIYTGATLLTALDRPYELVSHSRTPVMSASADFERKGYVKEVVFPTGMVQDDGDPDTLRVFYGCADSYVAVRTLSVSGLLGLLGAEERTTNEHE